MNTTRIQHQIEHLHKQLTALGPMHPGSLGEQYNVSGTPATFADGATNVTSYQGA